MGNWYVSIVAMTLATVLATISVLFLLTYAPVGVAAPFSFNLKKTLTVAQIAERFKSNTVLWAFHTIHPSMVLNGIFCMYALIR